MVFGMLMTLAVAMSSYALGIVFGSGIAAMKLSSFAPLRWIGDAYTTIIRGIPELLVIYLVFFGGGAVLRAIAKGLFGYGEFIDLPIFITGTLCIGVSAGAYSAEVIRGAYQAVPLGQFEAAKAVGMSKWLMFTRGHRAASGPFCPAGLGNVWQLTLKDTSLISVIGLVEIMRQAAVGAGSTKEPFTFYITAFVLYLGLASFSNRGFLRAEGWANRGVRKAA